MKKVLILMTVLAFFISAPLAMAQAPKEKAAKVKCCIKGKCKDMKDKAACEKKKGVVVEDCSACKKSQKK